MAVATAIVIALFAIGCNNRANNASVATEDSASQTEDKLDSGVNEYEVDNDKDSVITLILSDRDTVRIGATKRNIDFLVNKVGESFDSLVKKISGNYFYRYKEFEINVEINVDIDTVHDINNDGFNDLDISISATSSVSGSHIYFAVYFGDKYSHYHLHDYYYLGESYFYDRGEHYVDREIDDQGVLHISTHEAVYVSVDGEVFGGPMDWIIFARYQNGDFYVIGESNKAHSYSITLNYLTFEKKDELTGKVTELKHAPLKKLSEVFGHEDIHW